MLAASTEPVADESNETNNPEDGFTDYSYWRAPMPEILDLLPVEEQKPAPSSSAIKIRPASVAGDHLKLTVMRSKLDHQRRTLSEYNADGLSTPMQLTGENPMEFEDAGQLGDEELEDDDQFENEYEDNMETVGAFPYI
jgi:hypothetical protein